MDFFNLFKDMCRKKNLTIDAVMKEIGKSGIHVFAGWQQRNVLPRADDLLAISKVLGCSMEYLVTGQESSFPPAINTIVEKIEQLPPRDLEGFQKLSDSQLEQVINLIKSFNP